ncbi:hypothetical protein MBLNU230_g0692t1 [Neophaeotheca triangularis]
MSAKDAVVKSAHKLGLQLPEDQITDYASLMEKTQAALRTVMESEDYQPLPDFTSTPRLDVHFPPAAANSQNAWAYRFHCEHKEPSSSLLSKRTVCLKDNIAVASVPCLLGTDTFTGWTPTTDATVVTRILAAGGVLTGKAVCENLSRGAVSATAATGPVHNPYARGYSAGGSSSGTGALVASGAVDLGIGCDQGGSIRIPAALCGLYGFKATTGLVPYTGIASLDASMDSVGPMTKTVLDCAMLLQALAGVDGEDDRQIAGAPWPEEVPDYPQMLLETKSQGVKGLRIGVLKEGLESPSMRREVEDIFRKAVAEFEKLGAEVVQVSVPMHKHSRPLYSVVSKMGNHMGMQGQATGRRQVMLTDLYEKKGLLRPESMQTMSAMTKEGLVSGEYAWANFPTAYPKSVNLGRKLKHAYDTALKECDLLVMPTTASPAELLPSSDASPVDFVAGSSGKTENTCPFNITGHPALAMPIGFVPARGDLSVKLPASLQIVGKYWDEASIFKAAYAWETSNDWKAA